MINPDLYVTASSGQRQASAQVLDQLRPSLDWSHQPGSSLPVLDVGCGAGDTTVLELLPRLPADVRVVAADVSPDMLRKAAARFPEPRVDFQLLDIGTPHLRQTQVWRMGPYSKVFSSFCLHWVPDQRTALSNISELLTPGGEAVLVIVVSSPLFDLYEQLSKMPKWAEYMQDYKSSISPYQHDDHPDEVLRALLAEAGLTVKTLHLNKDFAFCFPRQQEMIDAVVAVNSFTARIPAAQREAYLRDLVSGCYANGGLSERPGVGPRGGVQYRMNFGVMVVHAVKNPQNSRPDV